MIYIGVILVFVSVILVMISLVLLKQTDQMFDRATTIRDEATLKIQEASDRIAELEVVRDEATALCAKIPMLHEAFPHQEVLLFAKASETFLDLLGDKNPAWTEEIMRHGCITEEYQEAQKALLAYREPPEQNKPDN